MPQHLPRLRQWPGCPPTPRKATWRPANAGRCGFPSRVAPRGREGQRAAADDRDVARTRAFGMAFGPLGTDLAFGPLGTDSESKGEQSGESPGPIPTLTGTRAKGMFLPPSHVMDTPPSFSTKAAPPVSACVIKDVGIASLDCCPPAPPRAVLLAKTENVPGRRAVSLCRAAVILRGPQLSRTGPASRTHTHTVERGA